MLYNSGTPIADGGNSSSTTVRFSKTSKDKYSKLLITKIKRAKSLELAKRPVVTTRNGRSSTLIKK
jgi:hypothetical protein